MKKLLSLTLLSLFCLQAFISFAQDATLSYAKKMGGTNEDVGKAITIDSNGNIYTLGTFQGITYFDSNTQLTSFGVIDAFITKHDVTGNLLWVKQIGGNRSIMPNCIKANSEGNIYIAGSFVGTADFDPDNGIFNLTSNYANGDNFTLKLNTQGEFIWVKQISGTGDVVTNSISIDADENILTTGLFSGTANFNPNLGINNITSVGGYDIFVLKLNASGNFIWAKQMGGVGYDYGQSIDIDMNGSIYTTGYFSGIGDFDPNSGVNNQTSFGDDDIFISKLDASGNFVWAKQMGGYNTDRGFSIAVDDFGNVYTTGFFNGTADFDPSTTIYNLTSSPEYSIFVSKLNSSGNFVWAKKMGGLNPSIGLSISLDISGNVYTTGRFSGTVNFNPNGGIYNMTAYGYFDVFISKLNSSGNFLWVKQLGGTSQTIGNCLVIDANKNVYITGYFYGITDFDPSAITYNLTAMSADAFIVKLSQIPLPNAHISNLPESVNKSTYSVARESIIHHYFLVKNATNNLPIQGTVINYTLSTSVGVLRQSLPSEANGLIDLNIKVGGDNPNISFDDWQGVGNATINFVSLANNQTVSSNIFASNPITINVIDKAQPNSKEYGFAFDLAVGAGIEFGKKIKIGSYSIGVKAASLKGGITFGPSVIINPITQDFWRVKIGSSLGLYGEASLGPELSFGKSKVTVGPSAEVGLTVGMRNEIGYDIDLNDDSKLLKLASVFCLAKAAQDPNLKMFAGIFNNLSQSVLPRKSESIAYSMGSNISLGVNLSVENQIANFKGYGKISKLEFGGGATVEGSMNLESITEKVDGEGSSNSLKITAGSEANVGFDVLANIIDASIVAKNIIPKIYSNSSTYKFSMTRNFDILENQNGGTYSFGSEKDETINGVSDYKITANNNYKYSNKVLDYLNSASINPIISNNGLAAFFVTGKSLPASLWQSYTSNTSIFKSVFGLNDFVLQNYQNNWTTSDVALSTTRDITLMKSPAISFSVGLGLNLDFSFGYHSWNSYNHNYKEGVYSKSLGKKLITLDMPDIYSNLEIPQTEPMGYFWNKVQQKLISTLPSVAQNAYLFVRDITQQVTNIGQTIFSNFSTPFGTRSLMNGEVIYDSKSNNPMLSANVPSVFTFTINPSPQVFNASTSLRFKYYYPENEIQGITSTDTLRIISDVFFLDATDGTTVLNQAPNGNFSIATQFSVDDLKSASLPLNSVGVVLFLPNGSSVWENIGSSNQTIPFNRLGVFAIGVKINQDNVAPIITVNPPTNFVSPNIISIELNDNQSGINWSKTVFACNGINIPISRTGSTNIFDIPISTLPPNADNVFTITILTYDFAGNSNLFSQTYPCASELNVHTIFDDIMNPVTLKASKSINSDGKLPINNDVIFKSGNFIDLKPGFESNIKTFKTELTGCNN